MIQNGIILDALWVQGLLWNSSLLIHYFFFLLRKQQIKPSLYVKKNEALFGIFGEAEKIIPAPISTIRLSMASLFKRFTTGIIKVEFQDTMTNRLQHKKVIKFRITRVSRQFANLQAHFLRF
ncbi:hypothetical protein K501DRAFT_279742 [Backusella circina FSU 941]|nr:hypothetical protein K501DRAFT_279742 [Backusella circina FSU 941]